MTLMILILDEIFPMDLYQRNHEKRIQRFLDGCRPFWRIFLQGTTVLHLASQSGHLDVLQWLLAAAAAPDLEDLQGRATQILRKENVDWHFCLYCNVCIRIMREV